MYTFSSSLLQRLALALVLIVLAFTLPPVRQSASADLTAGRILRVAPAGNDSSTCGSEAAPCRTIQHAVNLAGSGDTILVARGIYTLNPSMDVCSGHISGQTAVVCFYDKSLTILGGYTTDNWIRPDPVANLTVIDGQGARRGVRVQQRGPNTGRTSLRLEGFTIQNGLAQGATSGDMTAFGGGLLAEHAALTLRHLVFKNNQARGGSGSAPDGGIGAGGGLAVNADPSIAADVQVTMEDVIFEGNQALGGTGTTRGGEAHGGGLFAYQVNISGQRLVFRDNHAVGADSTGSGQTPDGQMADGLGGAASIEIASKVTLTEVIAQNNSARGGNAPNGDAGRAYGGAFFVEAATFDLQRAEVRGNLAQGGNGLNTSPSAAIAQGGGVGSVGFHMAIANVHLYNVALIGNVARSGNGAKFAGAVGGGGAALTYSQGIHEITNSIFADNLADVGNGQWVGGGGGGLWVQGGRADVIHTTFAGNRIDDGIAAAGGQGIAVIAVTPYPATLNTVINLSHSIIADHLSPVGSRAALQALPGTILNLNRGLWANNTRNHNASDGPSFAGTINGLSTWISASSAGFMAPGAPYYNYHLRNDSAAKNQATGSTMAEDFEGDARPFENVADLGADEYWPFRLAILPHNGALWLDWHSGGQMLEGGVKRYEVVVTCPRGANPPAEGRCDTPIDVGLRTTFTLTGLSNRQAYGVSVIPRDARNVSLATTTATAVPTDRLVFMPLALRARP